MADANPSSPFKEPPSFEDPLAPMDSADSIIDHDIDMAIDPDPNPNPEDPNAELPPEPRVPPKKDISLREFLSKMDDYAPIVTPPLLSSQ